MKKAVSALLILALLCTFCCTAMAAGEQRSGNFRYKVLSDGMIDQTCAAGEASAFYQYYCWSSTYDFTADQYLLFIC